MSWADVVEFSSFDERRSAIDVQFGTMVGVNDGYVEWCPDDVPPTEQQRLAWIWLCWPNLDEEIAPTADPNLRRLMIAYRSQELRSWWDSL